MPDFDIDAVLSAPVPFNTEPVCLDCGGKLGLLEVDTSSVHRHGLVMRAVCSSCGEEFRVPYRFAGYTSVMQVTDGVEFSYFDCPFAGNLAHHPAVETLAVVGIGPAGNAYAMGYGSAVPVRWRNQMECHLCGQYAEHFELEGRAEYA